MVCKEEGVKREIVTAGDHLCHFEEAQPDEKIPLLTGVVQLLDF